MSIRPFECLEQMPAGTKVRCVYPSHPRFGHTGVILEIVPLSDAGRQGRIHLQWDDTRYGGDGHWWEPSSFAPLNPLTPEEEVLWNQRAEEGKRAAGEGKRAAEERKAQEEDQKRREAHALKWL